LLLVAPAAHRAGAQSDRPSDSPHDDHDSPGVVKSLNGLTGQLTLAAGSNITIRPIPHGLQISAAGGGASVDTNAWHRAGDTATPGQFLGTLNPVPVEIKVNGTRALRLEPTTNEPNVIAGSEANQVLAGATGAAIGGGAGNLAGGISDVANYRDFTTIAGGAGNYCAGGWTTIGGGSANSCSGLASTIGGGRQNSCEGWDSVIGGGSGNTCTAYGGGTVAGGSENACAAAYAAIGGGIGNYIDTNALYAGIGSGIFNTNSGYAAVIAGGNLNTVPDISDYAAIGGGYGNTVSNSAFATIPGGSGNVAAGLCAFAAGHRAQSLHPGAFVWGDSTEADTVSTGPNQFIARASGGVTFFTSPNLAAGVQVPPGGGSWSSLSDRDAKEHPQPVNPRDVLRRVAALPIQTWNYKTQDASIHHIGPMAQDFSAAFNVGEDDKHISTVDADGVALAAIQGLNGLLAEKEARIKNLEQEVADLKFVVNQFANKPSHP
jgi:hypothetical protein